MIYYLRPCQHPSDDPMSRCLARNTIESGGQPNDSAIPDMILEEGPCLADGEPSNLIVVSTVVRCRGTLNRDSNLRRRKPQDHDRDSAGTSCHCTEEQ